MTGKEKIEAAFSVEGTREVAAVICYEDLYIRDHWRDLTTCPWWYQFSPDIAQQLDWRRQIIQKLGQDWFRVPEFYNRSERKNLFIQKEKEGIFLADKARGSRKKLKEPVVSGEVDTSKGKNANILTKEGVDRFFAENYSDRESEIKEGVQDLAEKLIKEHEVGKQTLFHVASPLWSCYGIWGFEDLMVNIIDKPELVRYACDRFLVICNRQLEIAKKLGAALIWIEECYTDMISPEVFKTLNLPYVRALTEKIKELGLKGIYYYTGNLEKKLDMIIDSGADALAFEEGKKGFSIDIIQIAEAVRAKAVLLGNLDSITVLQDGNIQDLKEAIIIQLKAAKINKNRFIVSTGSPPTPLTPPERIILYCHMVHELSLENT